MPTTGTLKNALPRALRVFLYFFIFGLLGHGLLLLLHRRVVSEQVRDHAGGQLLVREEGGVWVVFVALHRDSLVVLPECYRPELKGVFAARRPR